MGRAFTFADDYWEAAQCLPEEQRGDFFNAIVSYAFTGEEPGEGSPILPMFLLIRSRVDSSIKMRNRDNPGGRPRKDASGEHENEKEKEKENKKEYGPAKPTVNEPAKPEVKTLGFTDGETQAEIPRCPTCNDPLYSGHCFKCGVDVCEEADAHSTP